MNRIIFTEKMPDTCTIMQQHWWVFSV